MWNEKAKIQSKHISHKPQISSSTYTQYVTTHATTIKVLDSHYKYHKDVRELMQRLKNFSLRMLQIQVHIQQVHQNLVVECRSLISSLTSNPSLTTAQPQSYQEHSAFNSLRTKC